ncbi:MAG: hypothetical protein ACJ8AV_01090, partial [Gemmatimonadales bacterium]
RVAGSYEEPFSVELVTPVAPVFNRRALVTMREDSFRNTTCPPTRISTEGAERGISTSNHGVG